MNNRKICGLIAVFFAAFHTLYADSDDEQLRNLQHRVSNLEQKKTKSAMINPPARPSQKYDWGGILSIDVLLMEAHENGLGFGVRTDGNNAFFNSVGDSKVRNINFNWDWGFRLGIGANLPHDAWDLIFKWTRLHTSGSKDVSTSSVQRIFPVFAHPASVGNGSSNDTDADWRLRLNTLDLEMGREFFVSKWLTLRPHTGFRSAWVRQKLGVEYKDMQNDTGVSRRDVDQKCNYWGFGLRGGLDTQWGFGGGWSLFGNYAVSLIYGFFSTDHEEFTFNTSGNRSVLFESKDHYHLSREIHEMVFGLRWDYFFCCDKYHFGVELGWEHHMYPGQNQFVRYVDDVSPGVFVANQGDLTLQGWKLGLRFDF